MTPTTTTEGDDPTPTAIFDRMAARYDDLRAREVFANTVVPRDFDTIELPLPERGAPELRRGGAHPDEEKAP